MTRQKVRHPWKGASFAGLAGESMVGPDALPAGGPAGQAVG